MKRLYQYINDIKEDQFDDLLKEKEKDYQIYFKEGLANLKKVAPTINNNIILCYPFTSIDYEFDDNDNFIKTHYEDFVIDYYDGKDLIYYGIKKLKDIPNYGIEMLCDWKELLGSFVFIHDNINKCLYSILREIFFMGNSYELHQSRNHNLKIDLLERNQDSSHVLSVEDFIEKISQDNEDVKKELFHFNKLHKKYKKEIDNIHEEIREQSQTKQELFDSMMIEYSQTLEEESCNRFKKISKKLPFLDFSEDFSVIYTLNEIPEGWTNMTLLMFLEIQRFLDTNDIPSQAFHVLQVKEKYGSLSLYYSLDNEYIKYDENIMNISEKYRTLSKHVCMMCGRPHTHFLTKTSYIGPVCQSCYHMMNYNMPYDDAYYSYDIAQIPEYKDSWDFASILNDMKGVIHVG